MMNLTILGCHSATPRENKHTTSQLLELKGNLFLIDCGEGYPDAIAKIKN
jgi:ribonuclease Z